MLKKGIAVSMSQYFVKGYISKNIVSIMNLKQEQN